MAYPYSHVTRANGTILTASIYNTDHQNHIDNNIPTTIDDYSASTGQMQTMTDPGEAGSESLALTIAGELERIRFALAEVKGTTHWYETAARSIKNLNDNVVLEVQVYS